MLASTEKMLLNFQGRLDRMEISNKDANGELKLLKAAFQTLEHKLRDVGDRLYDLKKDIVALTKLLKNIKKGL